MGLQLSGKKSFLNIDVNTKCPTEMLLIKAMRYHLLLDQDIKLRLYPTKWTWPGHKQVHYWQKVQYFEDKLVPLAFPYQQGCIGTWLRSNIVSLSLSCIAAILAQQSDCCHTAVAALWGGRGRFPLHIGGQDPQKLNYFSTLFWYFFAKKIYAVKKVEAESVGGT